MPAKLHPHLALLRGINVGGKNIISKDDLRACFEDLGFENVKTYIQSGNILFRSKSKSIATLTNSIEKGLSEAFHYDAQAVVYSRADYENAVASAPKDWGRDDSMKHNAMFAIGNAKPSEIIKKLPEPKPKIEIVAAGKGVIFWSGSKKQITKTSMMKVGSMPVYKQMTVRNHNTTFKLLAMFEDL